MQGRVDSVEIADLQAKIEPIAPQAAGNSTKIPLSDSLPDDISSLVPIDKLSIKEIGLQYDHLNLPDIYIGPLLCDELMMPGKQRIEGHNRCDLTK